MTSNLIASHESRQQVRAADSLVNLLLNNECRSLRCQEIRLDPYHHKN
jgi:hypothetical protein